MNLYEMNYFVAGSEAVSFVVAENKENAKKLLNKGDDFELISIKACDLTITNIIHTNVYETV